MDIEAAKMIGAGLAVLALMGVGGLVWFIRRKRKHATSAHDIENESDDV